MSKSQNPLQRARDNIRKFVVRADIDSYEYATLGKPDGTIRAPGVRRVYIVKDNGVATALNEANVPHNAGLPLKVRFERGSWVIKGVDSRASAALAGLPDDPYGVPPHAATHQHGGSDEIATATPGADAIVKADADGKIGAGWIDQSDINLDNVTEGATNKFFDATEQSKLAGIEAGAEVNVNADWSAVSGDALILNKPTVYNQEEIEDFVGAMVASNTETGIAVTYDDGTGKLNFDAQTAGDLRYAPIAKGVTNGDSHDHLGGDGGTIAYSSLSGTPTVYTQEQIEDFVGAMVGGSETGISVTYDDGTGTLVFDAQTAGDARYGRLAAANSWTQNQTVASTQTSGNALRVIRDLASGSTDAAVVDIVQDNAGDDQAALRIQQDGAGDILQLFDGATKTFYVLDGGEIHSLGRIIMEGGVPVRFYDSDVAHGMTSLVASTNLYGSIGEQDALAGGMLMIGLSDADNTGALFSGVIGTDAPTATTPALLLRGSKKNGTTSQAMASNETVMAFYNNVTLMMAFLGNGNIGGGVAAPQGKLHLYDGTSGKPFITKTGVNGTAQTVIPDGTADIVRGYTGQFIAYGSSGSFFAGALASVSTPGAGNSDQSFGGGLELTLRLASTGELTVFRNSGTETWSITLDIIYQ